MIYGLLFGLGGLFLFIGYVWLVILGFKNSTMWGVLNLLIPICGIVFGFMNFGKAEST